MAAARPIIVIKKKGGHGGHHGGAWKVAYADFVTAMMSLFIVLWLMNSSKPIKEAVAGYFKDPAGTTKLTGGNGKGPVGEETLSPAPKASPSAEWTAHEAAPLGQLSGAAGAAVSAYLVWRSIFFSADTASMIPA